VRLYCIIFALLTYTPGHGPLRSGMEDRLWSRS
jgi:hypothetical protein